MICPKCGAQLPDNSTFCTNCGSPVAQAAPAYAPAQPAYAAPASDGTGIVHKTLKNLATSPLFLIAAIALTLVLVLNIVSSLSFTGSVIDNLDDYFDEIANSLSENSDSLGLSSRDIRDIRNAFDEMIDDIRDEVPDVEVSPASVITGQIPQILLCVGIWMLFVSALSGTGRMSGAGLTIIKVINLITFILLCIGFGLAVLGLAAGLVYSIGEKVEAFISAIVGAVLVIVAIVGTILIVYYAKLLKTINTMRSAVNTGAPSDRVSGFVAVICMITGISSGIYFFSSVSSGEILVALSHAANAAMNICFGLLIFRFRNTMRELMRMAPVGGFAPASYVQPPVNPYSAPLTVCPNCRNQHAATDAVCPFCGYTANPR